MSTYNRVVAADSTASLAPTVRARLATEMADPASDVGASLADTFATTGEVRSNAATDGTDQTATLNAELAALNTGGGGTLILPAGSITVSGQIIIPNDGGGIFATDAQLQRTMRIVGQGGYHTGQQQSNPTTGGTRLLMGYQSGTYNNAKIITRGLGRLVIRDLIMKSSVPADATPFLFTTNTTLHLIGLAFMGASSTATGCQIDAIVLGGTKKAVLGVDIGYDNPNSAFQGYGTVIERCYFDRIRRAVYGRSYANHTVTRDCFVEKTCGTNLAVGACIEFNGNLDVTVSQAGDYDTGDQVHSNYLNGLGYVHQIKLVQATRVLITGNGSPDPQANLLSLVGCYAGVEGGTTYPSVSNQIYGNHVQAVDKHLFEDTASSGRNTIIGGGVTEGHKLRGNVSIDPGDQFPAQIGKVNFTGAITSDAVVHTWEVIDPITAAEIPWRITNGGVNWLLLNQGASPSWRMAGRLALDGNTLFPAGSTALAIGNNYTASDAELVLNPPSGKNATLKFQLGGTNLWQVYNGKGTLLYVRDMAAGVMALTFATGATNTGSATFAGAVIAGGPVKPQSATTAARPSAGSAGVGAMVYDTTLSKPIWSDGTTWRDAAGTAV